MPEPPHVPLVHPNVRPRIGPGVRNDPRAASCFQVVCHLRAGHPHFTTPAGYRALEQQLGEAFRRHPVRLVTYCLMPAGWYMVVGPTDPRRLRQCLVWVERAHGPDAATTSVRPLTGIDDLIRAARQVERQALTAGLVRRAQDWPWGGLAGRANPANPLPLVTAPFLESRAWTDYVNAAGSSHDVSVDVPQHPRGLTGGLKLRQHLAGL